jgi:crotonobetainyl-CoA:carnitine CoA-transferase CaiB-like acyl-CoA transferase
MCKQQRHGSSFKAVSPSALDGLKVLELGQLIAGPFAAKIASLAKRFIKLHN